MPAEAITVVHTDLDAINEFIATTLGPAINGTPFELVNATFLSILVDRQGPSDLTLEELQEGVRQASAAITSYVALLRSTDQAN